MIREEAKLLIERLHDLWSTGDLSAVPSVYAEDFVAHMSFTSGLGTLRGREGVRNAIQEVRRAVTDFRETVQDLIVEGDKVVTRYVVTGIHSQPFRDVAPTGQPIRVEEISIYRVRDGLVAEQWCGRVADP